MNRPVPLLFVCAATVAISGFAVARGFGTDNPLPASEPSSSGATNAATATSGPTGATVPIKIVDFAFDPESITVAAGSAFRRTWRSLGWLGTWRLLGHTPQNPPVRSTTTGG